MIPANYQAPGTENMRDNPTQRESPGPVASPSGKGESAGGTENMRADQKTHRAKGNTMPSNPSGPTPPQSFTDDRV